jgi:hypothetical protein
MSIPRKLLFLASALMAGGALASTTPAPAKPWLGQADFNPGSQYTATLDQNRGLWRLQPVAGQDVVLRSTSNCATGAMVPVGVWLLVSDGNGQLELLAPSVTKLPAGFPDRVALRACDQAHGQQLAVPQLVIDLLKAQSGAIYVSN